MLMQKQSRHIHILRQHSAEFGLTECCLAARGRTRTQTCLETGQTQGMLNTLYERSGCCAKRASEDDMTDSSMRPAATREDETGMGASASVDWPRHSSQFIVRDAPPRTRTRVCLWALNMFQLQAPAHLRLGKLCFPVFVFRSFVVRKH